MQRLLSAIVLLAGTALAQVASPPPTVLPTYVFGVGVSDDRGQVCPLSGDVTFALLVQPKMYWWSNVGTPLCKSLNGQPTPSVITTGFAFVPASAGRVSLVLIVLGGLSISQAPAVATPAFSGSVGVDVRLASHLAFMPYMKALATNQTTPNGISTVLQFGAQLQYTF